MEGAMAPQQTKNKSRIYCAVKCCDARSHVNTDLSFHRFPKQNDTFIMRQNLFGIDEKINKLEAWKKSLQLREVNPHMTVCSRHFKSSDYFVSTVPSQRKCLKATAVPFISLEYTPGMPRDDARQQRRLKKNVGDIAEKKISEDNVQDSENSNGSSEIDVRSMRSNSKENIAEKVKNAADSLKKLQMNTKKFMENFNPETSARENRKLSRKLSASGKKYRGAVYDESGIHFSSGKDICDCLTPDCPGCFFECSKCNSTKCGSECRVNRKYHYEQADFEGINKFLKFADILKQ